ncbi:MAG: hypothetical protein V4683_07040 [Bacteroidota bacterium]
MTISGFTFLRNAHKLYYPIKESILSILDLVDEFVIALGEGDADDTSLKIIQEINSPKIKIINTKWDLVKYPKGSEYAHQTDIAKEHCTSDWLFYLQGDEVIHESDKKEIKDACNSYLNDAEVEGFVFNYLHFFGDYKHYFSDHCWYKKEIRIIRNLPEIHSWRDAQSFRFVFEPQKFDYHQSTGTRKLKCIGLNARVFHYGWVRPPELMKKKNDQVMINYDNTFWADYEDKFDYGRLDYCKTFKESHPQIMNTVIEKHYWTSSLRFNGPTTINRQKMKHERLKYRILIWIEENILRGYVIGGFKNYILLK